MIQICQLKGLLHIRDCYYVNQFGCVKNKNTNRKKVHSTDIRGYKYVTLSGQDDVNVQYKVFVHKLVALAYIPNPENRVKINHKDGKPSNNFHTNLEWSTRIENVRHAWRTGLIVRRERKFCMVYVLRGDVIERISSGTIKQLVEMTGIPKGTIYDRLYFPRKPYKWSRNHNFRIKLLIELP